MSQPHTTDNIRSYAPACNLSIFFLVPLALSKSHQQEGVVMDTSITRRAFAKTTVAAASGAAIAGVGTAFADESASAGVEKFPAWLGEPPVIDEADIVDTVTADIVVVGAGCGGSMCAFAATEGGASVAVVEAQPEETMSYYGLCDVANLNSQYVIEHGGKPAKTSEFIAEHQRRTHNRSNPALTKKFAENSGAMIDWMVARAPQEVIDNLMIHNVHTNVAYYEQGSEINRFTCWGGTVTIDYNATAPTLIAEAEANGAKWYWEHTGVVLETEESTVTERAEQVESDGSVTFYDKEVPQTIVRSVIARNADDQYVRFIGTKAVVLSCGDYGHDAAMCEEFLDEKRKLNQSHGVPTDSMTTFFGRDGSGIKMAMWAGGSIDPVPHTMVDPTVFYSSDTYATNVLRWGSPFPGAAHPWGNPFVWFDASGRRFTDETFLGVFGTRQRAERRKPGRYYIIFDSKWAELQDRSAPEHFSHPLADEQDDLQPLFDTWVERGALGAEPNEGESVCAWGAETLDDLLSYMPLDDDVRANIKDEIEKYNEYCRNGEDLDFGRDPKMLLPIEDGPFYGMYCVEEKPMNGIVALNGVVIDGEQRVLDKNYNPIVNLYATGNNSGGRFAVEYSTPMQGLTIGMAMTLGRVLGQELTAE